MHFQSLMSILQIIVTSFNILQVYRSRSIIIFIFQIYEVFGNILSSTSNCSIRIQISLKIRRLYFFWIITISITRRSNLFLMFGLILLILLNHIFLLLFLFEFLLFLLHEFRILEMSEINIHYLLYQSIHFTFIFFNLVYIYNLFLF